MLLFSLLLSSFVLTFVDDRNEGMHHQNQAETGESEGQEEEERIRGSMMMKYERIISREEMTGMREREMVRQRKGMKKGKQEPLVFSGHYFPVNALNEA